MKRFTRWLLLPILGLALTAPAIAGVDRADAGDRGRVTAREAREVHAHSARVRADRAVREPRGAVIEHTPRQIVVEPTKAQRIHPDSDVRVIRNSRHVLRHDNGARLAERDHRRFDAQDADLLRELDRPRARELAVRAARDQQFHRDFDRHSFDSRRFDSRSTLRHRRDFFDRHHDTLHHRFHDHGPRFHGSLRLGHFDDHGSAFYYRRSWPTWRGYHSPFRSGWYYSDFHRGYHSPFRSHLYHHYPYYHYPRHHFYHDSGVNLWFRF